MRVTSAEIVRYIYKTPGIHSISSICEATGCRRDMASRAMSILAEAEKNWFVRVSQGVYLSRPPESTLEDEPAPATVSEPEPTWQEMLADDDGMFLPDDEEIYRPFRVRIYDHFRGKRGEQWFRVKDDLGKRGIFRWIDDDD